MEAQSKIYNQLDAGTIIIKIGSSLLVDEFGDLRQSWLSSVSDDIASLKRIGKQVIIVSSGAIALGKKSLGLTGRPQRLDDAQASAAIGQIKLARAFEESLSKNNQTVAQLLLTLNDLEDRPRYLNARGTLEALLSKDIIPIINENDTVATSEIKFGDNDRLAARVAQLAGADLLFLLSDIDGLYSADPRTDKTAKFFPVVTEITPEILQMAGPTNTDHGTGGMATKIAAAQIALTSGCSMIIANGHSPSPISRILNGERHTLFKTSNKPLEARKQWIRSLTSTKGSVTLDNGAVSALKDGASILPVGITEVTQGFKRGDLITILDPSGNNLGHGLVSYDASEIELIKGKKLRDIQKILGYAGRSALIHRDDLILL
ncbi:glutamate 5-kinase [Kordiimonas sp. SCSIO 12610]|uniref:glutamate 5-kinase n=1 Tax=Kordiimonas sp. SCSIO 12610 TaxID=2829597 RepID=UPI00210E1002|nr:glutamate 5-kinase [Kordiimonas sp. SCSIO 12610]UTW55829.1 glutamate 5-kinase [Kordiimonas sp. SCSIO 12610]